MRTYIDFESIFLADHDLDLFYVPHFIGFNSTISGTLSDLDLILLDLFNKSLFDTSIKYHPKRYLCLPLNWTSKFTLT